MKVKTVDIIPINEDIQNPKFKIIINGDEVGIFDLKVKQTENKLFSSVFHVLIDE